MTVFGCSTKDLGGTSRRSTYVVVRVCFVVTFMSHVILQCFRPFQGSDTSSSVSAGGNQLCVRAVEYFHGEAVAVFISVLASAMQRYKQRQMVWPMKKENIVRLLLLCYRGVESYLLVYRLAKSSSSNNTALIILDYSAIFANFSAFFYHLYFEQYVTKNALASWFGPPQLRRVIEFWFSHTCLWFVDGTDFSHPHIRIGLYSLEIVTLKI